MPVYRIEVTIQATAYVRAEDANQAQTLMGALDGETFELSRRDMQLTDELSISGRQYDDPELPRVSLSPAMTLRVVEPEAEPADD
jgi:hypothetical protein